MKKSPIIYLLTVCFLLSFATCMKIDVFEKNVEIPKHEWAWDYKPEISFVISDTVSSYNIYLSLRHTEAYEYNTVSFYLKGSGLNNRALTAFNWNKICVTTHYSM
ncbi:MAG: hypothetical protein HYX40_06730 [Sphingobacteriales bacterium]|nr:hypothetical protein [Sphingobacteriales bacterium]